MAISKITKPSTPIEEVDKINELVDGVNNAGTVKKVNNTSPDSNGNVTLSIPDAQVQANWNETNTSSKAYIQNKPTIPAGVVVDQTYNASSANAQSGVAINGAKFTQNTATGTGALTINGTASNGSYAVNIGSETASTANYGTAIGYKSKATASSSIAIGRVATSGGAYSIAMGYGATVSNTGGKSIQLGYGTNSTATSLSVGFQDVGNYQLLDGSTGLIPDARISSNIARTSSLATIATSGSYNDLSNKPTIPTVNNATLTITQGGTTKGTFTANASSNVTIDLDAGGGGSSRNIGEIVSSTIPLTDAGLHLLDGALIQGSGIYSAFVTYIAGLVSTYPDLFTTESDWQSTVTQYGVCGKFVYDAINNAVRLPKITGIVEGTTDLTALGDLVEAGLPNIEGFLRFNGATYNENSTGAFYALGSCNQNQNTGSGGSGAGFDASRSNSIYGNSDTVQPQTVKVLYYIVIATSTKTDIQVDIDEITTDLNGKADADLSNVPTSKGILTESYINGSSWYRIYSDGWCVQGGVSPSAGDKTNNTIMLLRSYKDTNYSILYAQNAGVENAYTNGCTAKNKTTSSFVLVYRTGGVASFYWQACGYIR